MKETEQPTTYYDRKLAVSLTAIRHHNALATKMLGSWCATVLAKDDELMRWLIEHSRHTYSTARRRKLAEKLRWFSVSDYQRTGIRVHGAWNTYWGQDIVNIEVHVTNEFRLSIGIPFSAFTTLAGYKAWREFVRTEVLKKVKKEDERERGTYERLKKRFGS